MLTLGNTSVVMAPAGNSFASRISSPPGGGKGLDPDDLSTKQAKVLMAYEAVTPNEISVAENDILIIYRLPGMDPEFVMAEKGGNRGKVPISYLEVL